VRTALMRYLPLVLLAVAWELAARLHIISTLALPPLSDVATAWVDLIRDGELIDNGGASLYRAFAGLFLAIIVGGGLGMAMARVRLIDVFINPLVELFYPLPKSCLLYTSFGRAFLDYQHGTLADAKILHFLGHQRIGDVEHVDRNARGAVEIGEIEPRQCAQQIVGEAAEHDDACLLYTSRCV